MKKLIGLFLLCILFVQCLFLGCHWVDFYCVDFFGFYPSEELVTVIAAVGSAFIVRIIANSNNFKERRNIKLLGLIVAIFAFIYFLSYSGVEFDG